MFLNILFFVMLCLQGRTVLSRLQLLERSELGLGKVVWNNAVGFLRVCDRDGGDFSTSGFHPLDNSRIHPEFYGGKHEYAYKLCCDALEGVWVSLCICAYVVCVKMCDCVPLYLTIETTIVCKINPLCSHPFNELNNLVYGVVELPPQSHFHKQIEVVVRQIERWAITTHAKIFILKFKKKKSMMFFLMAFSLSNWTLIAHVPSISILHTHDTQTFFHPQNPNLCVMLAQSNPWRNCSRNIPNGFSFGVELSTRGRPQRYFKAVQMANTKCGTCVRTGPQRCGLLR